jgi:hypothetical protein
MSPTDPDQRNLPEDDVHAATAVFVDVLIRVVLARVVEAQQRTPEPRFLSKSALADHLGVSERTIKTLRARGLPARKIGRALYFDIDEVSRFIESEGGPSRASVSASAGLNPIDVNSARASRSGASASILPSAVRQRPWPSSA